MNLARRALLFDYALVMSLRFCGCASPKETRRFSPRPLTFSVGRKLLYLREFQRDPVFAQSLPIAIERLIESGLSLQKNSEIWIHEDVASFATHSKQSDPTLRAYSRYAIVHVLPRRYWSDPSKELVTKRLVHELVHLALFQSLGDESTARVIRPPFWFSEGLASVTAQQGEQRMPLALVVKRLAGRDALKLSANAQTPTALRYGIAHHAARALRQDPATPTWVRWIEHARANPRRGNIESSYEALSGKKVKDIWALTLASGK